ncbi:MAG: type II toxin-antitoxin system RatA family toxin [Alphaproteobacteria bacterium]|nr:type II toxin-antitoxin system RatA family toxin [Alphaproteobacteria bacterium]
MPTHAEKRLLPYSPEQLFDLVAQVERYPEFLPWCLAARIRSRSEDAVVADLVIGFRMIRERFTSHVRLDRARRIDVRYADGPFKYLDNHWIFEPVAPCAELPGGGTLIDFHVDFEFRSKILQGLIGVLFNEATRRMVAAFEARARQLYAPQGQQRDGSISTGG